ncbi:GNAT family N-acetyltransferase [Deinococcus yavapaiensis]|uniref:Acetyltransferase (GNAT) family protein n=1 Tax=Deinococcus yavapaiensis KR-236 TaxID=694435 RepID=A0A318S810_9DEIO|nr:GNAT family N-acetyltransferase [Deinococcus yavapaiensis]PYE55007.1 acetyltransferase (GNAT) family protein [Deinococcus yavapaiensis KR-236]
MITYTSDLSTVTAEHLTGFFVGWPNAPRPETLLRLLQGSYRVVLALEGERVVGFANAVSDGVLSAYVPLLEVLPEYQGRGVGSQIVRRLARDLSHLYMVDVLCDEDVVPFYERLGLRRATGVMLRNYERQSGE